MLKNEVKDVVSHRGTHYQIRSKKNKSGEVEDYSGEMLPL